jgi:hypothetical protein
LAGESEFFDLLLGVVFAGVDAIGLLRSKLSCFFGFSDLKVLDEIPNGD